MAAKPLPSREFLRQLLRYDPETGKLFWKRRTPDMFRDDFKVPAEHICSRWNSQYEGREALACINRKGYKTGAILSVHYRAHRIIWKMMTGKDPEEEIDHINRDQSDNRWVNLREASRTQNCRNVSSSRRGTSQYLGVHSHGNSGRWAACIRVKGKTKSLGIFDTEQEAAVAYDEVARSEFGEYASLNFP